MLLLVISLHQPVLEIKLVENFCDNLSLKAISIMLLVFGHIYVIVSFLDMLECSLIVWSFPTHIKREGCEVPLPFTMKNLSRVALSCRNPLMTG